MSILNKNHNLHGLYGIEDCNDTNISKADGIIETIKKKFYIDNREVYSELLKYKFQNSEGYDTFIDSIKTSHKKDTNDLILGTMNILGDASNPFEFKPPGYNKYTHKYRELVKIASRPFKTWTFELAFNLIKKDADADADADEDDVALLKDDALLKEVNKIFIKEFNKQQSIYDFFKENIELGVLSLDNKVKDRINPIVYAMTPYPEGNSEGNSKDTSNDTSTNQLNYFLKLADKHFKNLETKFKEGEQTFKNETGMVLNDWFLVESNTIPGMFVYENITNQYRSSAYCLNKSHKSEFVKWAAELEKIQDQSDAFVKLFTNYKQLLEKERDDEYKKKLVYLMFWDMLCVHAVFNYHQEFMELAKFSYLVNENLELVPKQTRLTKLFESFSNLPNTTPIVIGCQEMPTELPSGAITEYGMINYKSYKTTHTKSNITKKHISTITGFIYSKNLTLTGSNNSKSNADIETLSQAIRDEIILKLKEINTFGYTDAPKNKKGKYTQFTLIEAYNTTIDKLQVGQFTQSGAKTFYVIVFHCKAFKSDTPRDITMRKMRKVHPDIQAKFVDLVITTVNIYIKANGLTRGEVYAVGDMNIEKDKPDLKGGVPADVNKINEIFGMIPNPENPENPENTENNINIFAETKAETEATHIFREAADIDKTNNAKYILLPEPGTITTIKERALFQGQPTKANDLTVVHKDCIFIPSKHNVVKNVEIVGRLPNVKNMELLMPSEEWPADHFAILCAISTDVGSSKFIEFLKNFAYMALTGASFEAPPTQTLSTTLGNFLSDIPGVTTLTLSTTLNNFLSKIDGVKVTENADSSKFIEFLKNFAYMALTGVDSTQTLSTTLNNFLSAIDGVTTQPLNE